MRDSGKQIELNLGSPLQKNGTKIHWLWHKLASSAKHVVLSCLVLFLLSCSILWGLGGGIFHRALSQHVVATFGSDPTMPRGTKGSMRRSLVFPTVSVGLEGTWRSRHIFRKELCCSKISHFFLFLMIPGSFFFFPKKTWPIDSSPWTSLLKEVTLALHRHFSRTDPDLKSQKSRGCGLMSDA